MMHRFRAPAVSIDSLHITEITVACGVCALRRANRMSCTPAGNRDWHPNSG